MVDVFSIEYIYHIIYSQYERIFKDLQYYYDMDIAESQFDKTYKVTINQPSSGSKIVVTTLDDGIEHTESFTAKYNTVALCKFSSTPGNGIYLTNPAAVIQEDTTFSTTTVADNQTMVILIPSPCQTIYMAINDEIYKYRTSMLVDNGSNLKFIVHPSEDAQYQPGVLNKTSINNISSGIEYIYATLPIRMDNRLHEGDTLILDAGYASTVFPKESTIDNSANDGVCYESDYYNFKA